MKIEILFFDIDGTILPIGGKSVHAPVVRALTEMHDRGVRLFICTGRAPFSLPNLAGIPFDGAVCFNGAYCYDAGGLIHSEPLRLCDIKDVIRNAGELGFPVAVATARARSTSEHRQSPPDRPAPSEHAPAKCLEFIPDEPVYQMMIDATAEFDSLFVQGVPAVKTARWWDRAVDIIPAHWGKAKGMEKVLEHYGLERSQSMAFGDGANDANMLEYAGIGVAMGNAAQAAKEAADYVADSCENDGVVSALRHFGLL